MYAPHSYITENNIQRVRNLRVFVLKSDIISVQFVQLIDSSYESIKDKKVSAWHVV